LPPQTLSFGLIFPPVLALLFWGFTDTQAVGPHPEWRLSRVAHGRNGKTPVLVSQRAFPTRQVGFFLFRLRSNGPWPRFNTAIGGGTLLAATRQIENRATGAERF